MIGLAFDTALDACSVAVFNEGELLGHLHERMSKGHAECLMPMVESVMNRASVNYIDLDFIAVTVGPGTFTGVRVGLSAARALRLTTGLPIAGVSTLAAVAEGVWRSLVLDANISIIVLHDARRQELFQQKIRYRSEVLPCPPSIVSLEAVASVIPRGPIMMVGSGIRCLSEDLLSQYPEALINKNFSTPDAMDVASIGDRIIKQGLVRKCPPHPLYLRLPDARPPVLIS